MGRVSTWVGFKVRFKREMPEHNIHNKAIAVLPPPGHPLRVYNPGSYIPEVVEEGEFRGETDFDFLDEGNEDE